MNALRHLPTCGHQGTAPDIPTAPLVLLCKEIGLQRTSLRTEVWSFKRTKKMVPSKYWFSPTLHRDNKEKNTMVLTFKIKTMNKDSTEDTQL